jgi:hypothetical protein
VSIGLYMDVHVRSAVTYGLRRRGVDVLTANQDPESICKASEPDDLQNRVEFLPL